MRDWSNFEPRLLDVVRPVVQALAETVPPEQIMLVGAQCRDVLHSRFGGESLLRGTNDTDVALALQDWAQFITLCDRFDQIGDSGHRFLIAGVKTDVIPFGDVEAPPGASSHPPGKQAMNVHGFRDTYERADNLAIAEQLCIRIPRPEGYAILKTHAWLDRSVDHEYKDGPDLAIVIHWYTRDPEYMYDTANEWALVTYDFDYELAAAALLGRDMRNGLSPNELSTLCTRALDRDLLAQHFDTPSSNWPRMAGDRRPIVDALFDQLAEGFVQ